MTGQQNTRTGGQLIVDALKLHGVEYAFGVAGESYLEVLDALVDVPSIKYITCRQEGGAANMAEAYGKLTGKPGVCMVTRGPGATNASIGIHTAQQDSTPMVVLIGQVARDQFGREAFQEIDYRRFFAPIAKWVEQIDDAERIPEIMHRAFHIASSGRPGPVIVALPEDMLRDHVSAPTARPYQTSRPHPGASEIEALRGMLAKAKKPLLLVGGSGWSDEAARDISAFAEANNLPVCCSFRRQDVVSTKHPGFVGDLGTGTGPKLLARVKEADLLIVAGARLGEMTTQGYTLMGLPEPAKTMVHAHVDPIEIGRTFRPELGIVSGMPELAAALKAMKPVDGKAWADWTKGARAEFLEWFQPEPYKGNHLLCRRWRFRHDRPGTGDGDASWRQADHPGVQQQHVRHHPDASGKALSRPDQRHQSDQPGLCDAGQGAWRLWRDRHQDRGLHAGLRAGAEIRHGSDHRTADRPGTDQHPHHHHGAESVGKERLTGSHEQQSQKEAGRASQPPLVRRR